jgi:hypothetical protein
MRLYETNDKEEEEELQWVLATIVGKRRATII